MAVLLSVQSVLKYRSGAAAGKALEQPQDEATYCGLGRIESPVLRGS